MAPGSTRFLPFVKVGIWLLLWLATINLILLVLDDRGAFAWLPDRTSGIGYLMESKQRVDAATRAYESGEIADDRPLAAIIGISDVREGVRLNTLAGAMHDSWRIVGVAGAGAGISSVAEQASLVLDGRLRPDVVVIGISPMQMIERSDLQRAAKAAEVEGSGITKWRAKLRGALWIVRRRSDLNGWVDRTVLDARNLLDSAFGLETSMDARSPWRPMLRTLGAEHYPVAVLQQSLRFLEASGVRNPATFAASEEPISALGTMVGRFRAQDVDVVLIIMPRHPWVEAMLPRSVDRLIASRVRLASADADLPILDYSKAVPAEGFIDLVHLNTSGGEAFSKQLGLDLLALHVRRNERVPRIRPVSS